MLYFIQESLLWLIPLLLAITVHEAMHGYAADKLGDPTAKMLGRLTLNPIKHIDMIGTIVFPALSVLSGSGMLFGWAKPVPITWANLKNKRRDSALVAAAGPLSNIAMAVIWAGLAKLGYYFSADQPSARALQIMGNLGIDINCLLAVLNLLPLAPLDGGRIISSFLSPKLSYYFDRLDPWGLVILMVLLITGILNSILSLPVDFLVSLIKQVFNI